MILSLATGCAIRRTVPPHHIQARIEEQLSWVTIPRKAQGQITYRGINEFTGRFYFSRNGDSVNFVVPGPLGFPAISISTCHGIVSVNGEEIQKLNGLCGLLSVIDSEHPFLNFQLTGSYADNNRITLTGKLGDIHSEIVATPQGKVNKIRLFLGKGVITLKDFKTLGDSKIVPEDVLFRSREEFIELKIMGVE